MDVRRRGLHRKLRNAMFSAKKNEKTNFEIHKSKNGMIFFNNKLDKDVVVYVRSPSDQVLLRLDGRSGEMYDTTTTWFRDLGSEGKLLVGLAGSGFNDPIAEVDLTGRVLKEVLINDDLLRKRKAGLRLAPLQRKMRERVLESRSESATIIQSAWRGFIARKLKPCQHCGVNMKSSLLVALRPPARNLTPVQRFSRARIWKQSRNEELQPQADGRFSFCFGCVRVHVAENLLLKKNPRMTFVATDRIRMPEPVVQRLCSSSLVELYENLVGIEVNAAIKIQSIYRGYKIWKPTQCPICIDDVPTAHIFSQEHAGALAECSCCRKCWKKHIEVAVEEGKMYIKCPMHSNCGTLLNDSFIDSFAGNEIREQWKRNRSRNHSNYLEELRRGEGDHEFMRWANQAVRVCPSCNVLIYRYAGCDHMVCSCCGMEFDWGSSVAQLRASVQGSVLSDDSYMNLDEELQTRCHFYESPRRRRFRRVRRFFRAIFA